MQQQQAQNQQQLNSMTAMMLMMMARDGSGNELSNHLPLILPTVNLVETGSKILENQNVLKDNTYFIGQH